MEVAGVEPAGGGASIPVNKRGAELSSEALTHILTNFPDVDRRMLSQIVERWGGLSEELKGRFWRLLGVADFASRPKNRRMSPKA